ncbi:hypothetical protein [Caulobacter sp. X]|uniref:hypothetical protein n=1 Tax=Caulobacter sp. X TaxID=2048901 RepID=UPI000C150B83|nr:hypothetical protein [Caulobacter sp. X]PIB95319.1 hypothetical protein CSW60_22505 [Caulobacter sp. X]
MIKSVSTGFVALTVVGSVLIFGLTVAGVVVPTPVRVIALAATAISLAICMTAIALQRPL